MQKIIAQRYVIDNMLGVGGMGTVYRATDTQTEATVAIKQLKPELSKQDMIVRFRREGEALRQLNHPNIVKLLDAIEEAGHYYLVMEYVAGGDLSDLIALGTLSIERVVPMAIDLADALTRAHKLGIIHRDLKPANVLIMDDGTARLTDFGVAQIQSEKPITQTGSVVGTIHYLAPEVLSGAVAGIEADIWAFGMILFEMLTGKRPFHFDGITQTIMAIMNDPLPDMKSPKAIPDALADLVYRMLEKDPKARISSVRHVGALLEDIQIGRVTPLQSSRFATPDLDNTTATITLNHNLPVQTTAFIGREGEINALKELLRDDAIRLVTILGPGGMGKTRLSLETGEQLLAEYPDGVTFVDLTAISHADSIPSAIANAFDYTLGTSNQSHREEIISLLIPKRVLLIMDNFEHVIDGAGFVGQILERASQVTILATSRIRLSQSGETLFHLSGMDFPDWETPADAHDYAAVKLFMSSAMRALPSFEIDEDNLDDVARICRLVQGMPLGIVLAGAWLAMLSPAEIVNEIQTNLDFLEADGAELPERQRSIRVVCDYAWQTLPDAEQTIFSMLSIFRDGFTREAAQAVTGASLRQLMTLVNKSLIMRNADTGRYHIHELLRQFAYEKLTQSKQLDVAEQRHAQYFAQLLGSFEPNLHAHGQLKVVQQIRADFENIIQAWEWAVKHIDEDALSMMLASLGFYLGTLRDITYLTLLSTTLEKIEESVPSVLVTRLKVIIAFVMPNEESIAIIDECIRIFDEHGEVAEKASAYLQKGRLLIFDGRMDEAYRAIKEGERIAHDAEIPWLEGEALVTKGYIESTVYHDYETAQASNRSAHAIFEATGNLSSLSWVALNIGEHEMIEGNYDEAEQYFMECYESAIAFNNTMRVVMSQDSLAAIAIVKQDYDKALQWVEQAVRFAKRSNNHFNTALAKNISIKTHTVLGLYDKARAILDDNIAQLKILMPQQSLPPVIDMAQLTLWVANQRYDEAYPLILTTIPTLIQREQPVIIINSLIATCVMIARDGAITRATQAMSAIIQSPYGMNIQETPYVRDMIGRIKTMSDNATFQQAWDDGSALSYVAGVEMISGWLEKKNG